MCGFAGIWTASNVTGDKLEVRVRDMADSLQHRGPDDGGTWVSPADKFAMGFRRLAIIDLSADGHQPMVSRSGRYTITFNGELYNFAELKVQLMALGHLFSGKSDTEVMLAAVENWGISAAVKKFNGMFAVAVWDGFEKKLYLARDRFGVKPLYFVQQAGTISWASELKALRRGSAFEAEICPDALTLYLRHGYVPSPYSIYKGVCKVPAASLVTFSSPNVSGKMEEFWSVSEEATSGSTCPIAGSDDAVIDAVEAALRRSVRMQMVADVPLGAFLSGGIDSSLIVALMQAESAKPVKTFSIGYSEDAVSEAANARAVAEHLGTEHTEWCVTPKDALEVIPKLADMYDEPFADPAMVPTYLVSKLAREKVTVSLSGDGGDELFGGYYYHVSAAEGPLHDALKLPSGLRRLLAALSDSIASVLEGLNTGFLTSVASSLRYRTRYLQFTHAQSWYRKYVEDHLGKGDRLAKKPTDPHYSLNAPFKEMSEVCDSFMLLDAQAVLPDGFLTKVDRATMAVSLEGRVPFLENDLCSLAWRIPVQFKVRNGKGKWVLRKVLSRYLPESVHDRPKQGFGIPINSWLRGPLKSWAEELLDPDLLHRQGLLSVDLVKKYWHEHQQGIQEHTAFLWRVLMLQAWRKRWMEN